MAKRKRRYRPIWLPHCCSRRDRFNAQEAKDENHSTHLASLQMNNFTHAEMNKSTTAKVVWQRNATEGIKPRCRLRCEWLTLSIEGEETGEGIIVYGVGVNTSYKDNRKFKFLGCSNFKTQIHTPGGACAQGWAHCFLQAQEITLYAGLDALTVLSFCTR